MTTTTNTYTLKELVRYAYLFSQYELVKYRYNRETDSRLREILFDDLQRAYNAVIEYRKLLGMN